MDGKPDDGMASERFPGDAPGHADITAVAYFDIGINMTGIDRVFELAGAEGPRSPGKWNSREHGELKADLTLK